MKNESPDFYQDVYEMCCEAIDPHLLPQNHGMFYINRESLIPSVVESLEYLIEFWVLNRDKPEAVHTCENRINQNTPNTNHFR